MGDIVSYRSIVRYMHGNDIMCIHSSPYYTGIQGLRVP